MLPKAPQKSLGQAGIEVYRARLRDHRSSLRSRMDRDFHRKDLAARAKRYTSLQDRHEPDTARHFAALARLHWEELDAFGPEPPPKQRKKQPPVPLAYPDFAKGLTLRVHFLERGSLRRERSAALAVYADAVSRQVAPNGDSLLSVAVRPDRTRFFERLMESIGADGLGPRPFKSGSFGGDRKTGDGRTAGPDWDDPGSPWRRISDDNGRARLYHWSAPLWRGEQPLPGDLPPIPESLPWDPDPRFHEILALTQTDRLREAMALVDAIPGAEREVLFDEVLYLRSLLGEAPRAGDIRYLARKYVAGSAIQALLVEDFEAFLDCLDEALADAGSISSLGLDRSCFWKDAPLKRAAPLLKDWAATRQDYYRQMAVYSYPGLTRGRIFIWHPDIAAHSFLGLQQAFEPHLTVAENAFRRARGIAEIGRGWTSEGALVDLIRSIYPDAIHQWRPKFLGSQSVDVYIPSINLAIEYQGEQHYRPVAVFGGEDGFEATRARDARKRALLRTNGVRLLEWRYDRPIGRAEIETALRSRHR